MFRRFIRQLLLKAQISAAIKRPPSRIDQRRTQADIAVLKDLSTLLLQPDTATESNFSADLVKARAALPAGLERFEQRLRYAANMYHRNDLTTLKEHPALCVLFLFHGSGHVRQEALSRLPADAATSPIVLFALMRRLNDWALPVRQAAIIAFDRLAKHLEPRDIALLLPKLARDMLEYSRAENPVFKLVFRDTNAGQEAMIYWLGTARQGPAARIMARLLQGNSLDAHLMHFARSAAHPHVRQIAAKALLTGQAEWHEGWQRVPVDKSLGQFRMTAKIGTRALSVGAPAKGFVTALAHDKSARVRRLAADQVILKGAEALPKAELEKLCSDQDKGVLERMAFASRKWNWDETTIS